MKVQGEDVTDLDVLKAIETTVRRSMSLKRIKIDGSYLKWTNVATAILKGVAQTKSLRRLELMTPRGVPSSPRGGWWYEKSEPKTAIGCVGIRWVSITWHHMTSHDTGSLPLMLCISCPKLCLSGVRWSVGTSVSQWGLVSSCCCTGEGALWHLTDRGDFPHWRLPVVQLCGSVDWPHTLLFTWGKEGLVPACLCWAGEQGWLSILV